MPEEKRNKRERREAARQERIEAQKKRQRRKARRKTAIVAIVILAVIGGAAFLIVRSREKQVDLKAALAQGRCSEVLEHEDLGRNHLQSLSDPHPPYNSNPPSSGPHFQSPGDWDNYPETVPAEMLVHNLEHGGIVVHYKDLSDSDLDELEKLWESYDDAGDPTQGGGRGVILNPNPDLEKPIGLAAWTKTQTCEKVSIPVIRHFIKEFCRKGPEPLFRFGCE